MKKNGKTVCFVEDHYDQWTLEFNEPAAAFISEFNEPDSIDGFDRPANDETAAFHA